MVDWHEGGTLTIPELVGTGGFGFAFSIDETDFVCFMRQVGSQTRWYRLRRFRDELALVGYGTIPTIDSSWVLQLRNDTFVLWNHDDSIVVVKALSGQDGLSHGSVQDIAPVAWDPFAQTIVRYSNSRFARFASDGQGSGSSRGKKNLANMYEVAGLAISDVSGEQEFYDADTDPDLYALKYGQNGGSYFDNGYFLVPASAYTGTFGSGDQGATVAIHYDEATDTFTMHQSYPEPFPGYPYGSGGVRANFWTYGYDSEGRHLTTRGASTFDNVSGYNNNVGVIESYDGSTATGWTHGGISVTAFNRGDILPTCIGFEDNMAVLARDFQSEPGIVRLHYVTRESFTVPYTWDLADYVDGTALPVAVAAQGKYIVVAIWCDPDNSQTHAKLFYGQSLNVPPLKIPRKNWAQANEVTLRTMMRESGVPENLMEELVPELAQWSRDRALAEYRNYTTIEDWADALREANS